MGLPMDDVRGWYWAFPSSVILWFYDLGQAVLRNLPLGASSIETGWYTSENKKKLWIIVQAAYAKHGKRGILASEIWLQTKHKRLFAPLFDHSRVMGNCTYKLEWAISAFICRKSTSTGLEENNYKAAFRGPPWSLLCLFWDTTKSLNGCNRLKEVVIINADEHDFCRT